MSNNQWKIATAWVQGRSHLTKNTPCQDRTFQLVENHKTGTFYGISLADGAGSCSHSDIGAEVVTNRILFFLKSNFSSLFKKNNIDEKVLVYIEKELKKISKQNNYDLKDLSSTLLFIAIKNDSFIIGHIGDGIIGVLNNENKISVISYPENGEFANSTYFTTSLKYEKRLKILKGTIKNSLGFILMSDGTGESLYDKKNKILIDINADIINWLENNSEKDVKDALNNNLKEVISQRTLDDCSIGIIRKD
jgi:serine/threonine protein phosphatase PrpC